MAYLITQPNGQIIVQIPDGTADGPQVPGNAGLNTTDVNLIGQNYLTYGALLNENFITLLQNSANTTPPSKPLPGELWYDTGTGFVKVYNGTNWLLVSPVIVAPAAPSTTVTGTQWWDSTNQQLKIWNGTGWTTTGPAYSILDGISGAIVETVYDTSNVKHTVVKTYTNGNVVAISSYDQTFTPLNTIPGFATINPGITLNSADNNNFLYGTVTNAQNLGNISANNYARTDITSTFAANVGIGGGTFTLKSHTDGHISLTNTTLHANTAVYNNVNGVSTKVFEISGLTGLATVAGNPTNNLGIATKQYVDNNVSIAVNPLAPLLSPSLTGVPTAPTPAQGTTGTQIATTEFVQTAIATDTTALWLGSNKTVSTSPPNTYDGNVGDFWFQI